MFGHETKGGTHTVEPTSAASSSPDLARLPGVSHRKPSRFNPKTWNWKVWVGVIAVIVAVLIAAIVGGVLGARANAYPNYSRIEYKLQDTYAGETFFDQFDFFTGYDPTHGFVHYVDSEGSMAQNLTEASNSTSNSGLLSSSGTAVMRVDTTDKNATTGRKSVRITSKKTYDTGLFIFDVVHSPHGCATWPALWLTDTSNWPENGEIDVMEGVNTASTGNQVTLHTSNNCKIGKNRRRKQTGKALSYNCYNGTNSNEGCGVQGPTNSFGSEFNDMGGGVYALELRNQGIRVWMFNRSSIPDDISNNNPDPSTWPKALADFPNLECDIGSHFRNQSIIANIDLCGDWAGRDEVFGASDTCTGKCDAWVASRAESFDEAYWEFGGVWVYGGV